MSKHLHLKKHSCKRFNQSRKSLFQMKGKTIFTLLGVLYLRALCVTADQSGISDENSEPMSNLAEREKARDTPEVVLQLKYNDGELNKIYLTQFRKESKGWLPSVSGRRNLCADLCRAGFVFFFSFFCLFRFCVFVFF